MFGLIRAEWMKYRRTAVSWLLFLAPVGCILITGLYVYPHRFSHAAWIQIVDTADQVWSGIWIPLGVGLIAGLSAHMEVRAGSWRALRGRNVSPARLYGAKLVVLGVQMGLSTLWLTVLLVLMASVYGISVTVPWRALIAAMVVNWFGTLPLLYGSYWIAEAIGWAVSIGLGILGILIASIIGATSVGSGIWVFIPWAWPMRLLVQVYAFFLPHAPVHPSPHVFWGVVAASAVLACTLAWSGTVWFHRREAE
ncbi:MAG: ABC transporter permease [Alicyclobacillaceae bacterium]|nr:ABC transporter permease [Alicyclobacillaceae bacterium]